MSRFAQEVAAPEKRPKKFSKIKKVLDWNRKVSYFIRLETKQQSFSEKTASVL